jgi:hypothetical protein
LIKQAIEARREISLEPSPNSLMVQRQGGADLLDSVTLVGKQDDSCPNDHPMGYADASEPPIGDELLGLR